MRATGKQRVNADGKTSRHPVWPWILLLLLPTVAFAQSAPAPDTNIGRVTVVMTTIVVVVLAVVLHYESLYFLTLRLQHINLLARLRILLLIFAILATHVVEIWIFGAGYYLLTRTDGQGALLANHAVGLLDAVYFSAVCFTTLGLGDIVPTGAIRFLVGTEALTGFVLITWSASFTFVEMQRFWRT
jgi:uncharacterized membrane protein YhaH (DUF805 family)